MIHVFRGRLLDKIIRIELMMRRRNMMQFPKNRLLGHDLSGTSPQSVILG
jgi:hypothetical protein